MKNIILLLIITLFASCSFNKVFLKPGKFPPKTTRVKITNHDTHDTSIVHFSGNNFQPIFISTKNDTLKQGYTIESLLFKNGKGALLNGWFLKPVGNDTATITLFHLHGNEGSLLVQYQAIAPLVKKGIQVFTFDYSGYGFSEGEATQKNIRTDALAALDYIRERADVKNTRIVIYGQSLGGHLGAIIASERQDMIAGLVMEGAFSSPKDIAAYTVRKSIGLGFIGRMLVKSNYSARSAIKNYHKPLLVIHSIEDKEVPYYMGQTIYDHANAPKQFYQIKGAHISGPRMYPDSISARIKAMLK